MQQRRGVLTRLHGQEVPVAEFAHQPEGQRQRSPGASRLCERESRFGEPVVRAHPLVVVLATIGLAGGFGQDLARHVWAPGAQLAPRQQSAEFDLARAIPLAEPVDGRAEEFHRPAVLAAGAEDPSAQREQVAGDHLHAQLVVLLLGGAEFGQRSIVVPALGEDLRERAAAGHLLRAIAESPRGLDAFLGGGAGLGEPPDLGHDVCDVGQVERRAGRGRSAHACERGFELANRVAKVPHGAVGHREVVQRRQFELGVGRSRQQTFHFAQDPHRGALLPEVEMRSGLALQQADAPLDVEVLGHRQPALGHAEHLLVAAAHVEHLAEPEQHPAGQRAQAGFRAAPEQLHVEALGLVPLADGEMGVGQRHAQFGILEEGRRRQVEQVLAQAGGPAFGQHARGKGPREVQGPLRMRGKEVVTQRALVLAARGQHAGRVFLERRPRLGTSLRFDQAAEELANQGVELVRGFAGAAETPNESAAHQPAKHRSRVARPGKRRRQTGIEALERGHPFEQPPLAGVESRVNFSREEVLEIDVRTAQFRQHLRERASGGTPQGFVDQVDGGGPALRHRLERLQFRLLERTPVDFVEQLAELVAGVAEMTRIQLEDLPANPQPFQCEGRGRARADQHPQGIGKMPEHLGHECVDRGGRGDFVVVVEQQVRDRTPEGARLVHEHSRQPFRRRVPAGAFGKGSLEMASKPRR